MLAPLTLLDLTALKDKLQAESRFLQSEIKGEHDFEEIIGSSPQTWIY